MIPAIRVRDLNVVYGNHRALTDVDLSVAPGTLHAIIGPNGAGKSTLLKAILGLVPRLTGSVELLGRPFRGSDPAVAYVPQRDSVDWDFPATVEEIAEMGTYAHVPWFRRPGPKERAATTEALLQVGLSDLRLRPIHALSGGQQQRLFLARALAQRADLLLMDEPFVGIDAASEEQIFEVLRSLAGAGKTVVVVHHDLATVREKFHSASLLKTYLVADGPVSESLSATHLREAYGDPILAL